MKVIFEAVRNNEVIGCIVKDNNEFSYILLNGLYGKTKTLNESIDIFNGNIDFYILNK